MTQRVGGPERELNAEQASNWAVGEPTHLEYGEADGGSGSMRQTHRIVPAGVVAPACLQDGRRRNTGVVSQTKSLVSAVAFPALADIGFPGKRNNPGTPRPFLSQAVLSCS